MKLSFDSTWLCIHHAFIASKGEKNEGLKIKVAFLNYMHVHSNIGENQQFISQTLLSHGQ